mgnify:CR=1 FL=1
MKIGIVDADLISQIDHNFPNLALMKISGFYKSLGHDTELVIDYQEISPSGFFGKKYDMIFISMVFTDSHVPDEILQLDNVKYGGTGFFYDKAPRLPDEIEHHFPDYHLYDKWIKNEIRFHQRKPQYFRYYTEYSIGFTTRGCFRQCEFCVNRNEKRVYPHSSLKEFFDPNRKKICLLDDNVFGLPKLWKDIFEELIATNKPFQYKQGLDIRILTDQKAEVLSRSKYDGDHIFAFDNYKDRVIIERKIQVFKKYLNKRPPKFYIFCAFDRDGKWDSDFWEHDIIEIFERLKILMRYKCIPYLMKFERWKTSPFPELYADLTSWCNVPAQFKKQSFNQTGKKRMNYLLKFKKQYPHIVEKYFDLKYGEIDE